ncbi:hypothetical protein LWI28_006345 [Acer negundo]|uniref:Uncharacterized protein n=1 Tax=Acer negundo TaxID=4023 RepID=A0AAD5I990_ACENE|nr:hypothetical protein LWI28_006345 [Acer negundo]
MQATKVTLEENVLGGPEMLDAGVGQIETKGTGTNGDQSIVTVDPSKEAGEKQDVGSPYKEVAPALCKNNNFRPTTTNVAMADALMLSTLAGGDLETIPVAGKTFLNRRQFPVGYQNCKLEETHQREPDTAQPTVLPSDTRKAIDQVWI